MQITKNQQNALSRRQVLKAMAAFSAAAGFELSGLVSAAEKEAIGTKSWPLWKVEKAGHTVYLMGQTPPRATAWSDTRIESLVKICGTIWTETNRIHRQNPKALALKYGLDPKKPLSEWLSAADLTRVKQAAELAKLPLEMIAPLRPWLAASMIESAYFQAMKLDEQGTAESVLLRSAQIAKVPQASEFETQDDVLQFMGEMSAQEDVQFLQYTLNHILAGTIENERVYSAWAHGDTTPAAEFVDAMKRSQPDLYAKHVVGRNRNWLPRFAAMQKQTAPSLVIVGLYHMVGPDSLVEQLKADGWRLQLA
ncbi:TraB/GumN family protein [Undibacterium flavidum]|uniref:TraB/GumN family protein n=1 Tax=Undibacterium flavidum TaxID=2762297 RepID=A0ABR6YGB0_9BURK|nr:TraB/GumN family protein [Undibacterium flavidum]MBC3875552.1 TraB/GumN family protein [Undibacterium flavidum]